MGITIGKLAARFGLSRSTLLYYHSIALLIPSSYQEGEYRIYSQQDSDRLEKICMFRLAGVPLDGIRKILDGSENDLTAVLQRRFLELAREILKLQEQQRIITGLLQNKNLPASNGPMNKKLWARIMASSGFSMEDMRNWHISFEKTAPEKHEDFLRHLNISAEERQEIRNWKN